MAQETVFIDFVVDYDQLTNAQQELAKTGKVDTAAFSKIQSAINETATDSKGLIKTFKDVAGASIKMGKSVEDAFASGITDALDEAGVSLKEFEGALKKTTQPAQTLKKEMQQLKEAMARMKAEGKDTGKEFDALRARAGKLADAIADANAEIKNAGSDTKGIDNVIGSISALAGGYAAVQGAAALFGEENEDLQKALLKVNGAMAIATGTQQLLNAVQKEGALVKLKDTIATGAQTAATTLYTFVMGGATVATKVFRAALVATGIGAIIVLLGSLISAMSSYGDETKEAKEAQDQLRNSVELMNESLDFQISRLKRIGDERAAQLQSQGATEAVIAAERIKNINAEIELLKQKEANSRKLADSEKTGSEEQQMLYKEANDFFYQQEALKSQIKIVGFNDDNKRREEALKKEKEFLDKRKKQLEDARKEAEKQADEASKNFILSAIQRANNELDQEFIAYNNKADLDAQLYDDKKKNADDWDKLHKEFQASLVESSKKSAAELAAIEAKKREDLIKTINTVVFAAESVNRIFSELSSQQTTRDQEEIASQRRKVEEQLRAGTITQKAAEARQKQIDQQERLAKQRQAEREKKAAVFQALIAIPKAFLQGLSNGGPILGAIYAALAAVEAALIISRPVPKFFRGKKDSYEGPGIVGDMGSELRVNKDGSMQLYTKPTQTYIGAQDKIYTASETRNMLHNSNLSTTPVRHGHEIDYNRMAAAMPKQAAPVINIDKEFISESVANGLQRVNYMDRRYSSKR